MNLHDHPPYDDDRVFSNSISRVGGTRNFAPTSPTMTQTGSATPPRSRYHRAAYPFVLEALARAQEILGRPDRQAEDQHVTGPELLQGFRELAYEQFGGLALTVFRQWGLTSTNDVGNIVWDLIEKGHMRKTERDRLTDFYDLYSFEEVFGVGYRLNVSAAFAID